MCVRYVDVIRGPRRSVAVCLARSAVCYTEKAGQAQQHPGTKTTRNPAEDDRKEQCAQCCHEPQPAVGNHRHLRSNIRCCGSYTGGGLLVSGRGHGYMVGWIQGGVSGVMPRPSPRPSPSLQLTLICTHAEYQSSCLPPVSGILLESMHQTKLQSSTAPIYAALQDH